MKSLKTAKEGQQARGTHFLECEGGGKSQDIERKRTRKWVLTNWRVRREGQVGTPKDG